MSFSKANSSGLAYLNTNPYIKNRSIHTTLHSKPSDTHAYLNPSSCHPKHVCCNIPKGVAQTVRRICSEEEEYQKQKIIMTQKFVQRGYNYNFIKSEFDKFDGVDRLDLIGDPEISFDDVNPEGARRYPLVLDFHPSFSGASAAINKHKHLLDLDENLKNIISKNNIFVTFRKSKSLGDALVHSRYPYPYTKNIDSTSIGNRNCKKCSLCKLYLSDDCDSIISSSTSESHKINQTINCTDPHVIYCITDLICVRQNVGSTDVTIRSRFSNHKSHIKKYVKNCRVACHFNEDKKHKFDINNIDATLAQELRVTLIDKVVPEPWDTDNSIRNKLLAKESYWQHRLGSLESAGGLNVRNERLVANNRAKT